MKTYNKEDLITWINSEKAVIGNEYYFGDFVEDLNDNIKRNNTYILTDILNGSISHPFVNKGIAYACILPVDAVKEENTYRPCKTVHELCELVSGNRSLQADEQCSLYLIGCKVHIRNKITGSEYYTTIITITVDVNNYVKISLSPKSYQSFNELFKNYEIKINGEWRPFGVLED